VIRNDDIRAFNVQGGALFACTAAAGETFNFLAVASRAGLDVRWLFGRRHRDKADGDGIRRFMKIVSSVAVHVNSWRLRSARTLYRSAEPKSPQQFSTHPDPTRQKRTGDR
jgi:hypothetical protein